MTLFAPELIILSGCLLLFFVSLGNAQAGLARGITIATALAAVVGCALCLNLQGELFFKAYRVDFFSQLFKLIIALGLFTVLLFGRDLKGISKSIHPEYYLFMLLSTTGLMMLVSSVELITLFVALELSSYPLYLLVPMRDDTGGLRTQMEAATKYIMFGVLATGIMLFGMSYIFGMTGTTYLIELFPRLEAMGSSPAIMVGIAMFMGGFFFKLAVFPFHFWVPDVYEGASNETTAFIASVPKIGAVVMLIQVAAMVTKDDGAIVTMLSVLAVCSMFYGNLSALVQKDLKRMLGFSGIAHAGYVLLGLVTLKSTGFASSIFYIIGYLIMNLACFLVICKVSREGENVEIEDVRGLFKRAPLLALTLGIGMFALAGIPPFVGFMGKFMLLAGALNAGHLTLVILAALNTAISIFYYLSVVRVAYCTDPEDRPAIQTDTLTGTVSVALMVVIVAMGVAPNAVLNLAHLAVQRFF